jgi:hypothetical protein
VRRHPTTPGASSGPIAPWHHPVNQGADEHQSIARGTAPCFRKLFST